MNFMTIIKGHANQTCEKPETIHIYNKKNYFQ